MPKGNKDEFKDEFLERPPEITYNAYYVGKPLIIRGPVDRADKNADQNESKPSCFKRFFCCCFGRKSEENDPLLNNTHPSIQKNS